LLFKKEFPKLRGKLVMDARPNKQKRHRQNRPMPNPYRDRFRRELGYKIDGRTTGCLAVLLVAGIFLLIGLSFLTYWLTS
jgi:hypothetical protein